MQRTTFITAIALLAATLASPGFAIGDDPLSPPVISCGNGVPGGINCLVSKRELKEARGAFREGMKLEDQRRLDDVDAERHAFGILGYLPDRALPALSSRSKWV